MEEGGGGVSAFLIDFEVMFLLNDCILDLPILP
jgi:hypothetical protein